MKPITLKHGDEIRVESDRPSFRYMNKLEVGTIRGYAVENNDSPEASIATALEETGESFTRCSNTFSVTTEWTYTPPNMIKLTKPQLELLRELHAQSTWGMYCVDTYPPCIKLQSHGLARYRVGDLSMRLYITDAGHKYLRDLANLEHKPA